MQCSVDVIITIPSFFTFCRVKSSELPTREKVAFALAIIIHHKAYVISVPWNKTHVHQLESSTYLLFLRTTTQLSTRISY
jgi:hypothetical protein